MEQRVELDVDSGSFGNRFGSHPGPRHVTGENPPDTGTSESTSQVPGLCRALLGQWRIGRLHHPVAVERGLTVADQEQAHTDSSSSFVFTE